MRKICGGCVVAAQKNRPLARRRKGFIIHTNAKY